MKTSLIFQSIISAILCMGFSSCEKENDTNIEPPYTDESAIGGASLQSLNGHNIDFYYKYNNKLYRSFSMRADKDGMATCLSYSASHMYGNDSFEYVRTGANTAKLSILTAYESNAINEYYYVDPIHKYNLDMTYVKGNQGRANVKHSFKALVYGLLTDVYKKDVWYFILDSSNIPNANVIDAQLGDNDDSDKSDENEDSADQTETPGVVKEIEVTSISDITSNSAFIHGSIDIEGDYKEIGIVCINFTNSLEEYSFSLPSNPDDFKKNYGAYCREATKAGDFTIKVSNLKSNTNYTVAAYAITGDKLKLSPTKKFTTL